MNQNLMTQDRSKAGEYQESKELSEIKGKMFLARQFPRDDEAALQRVLRECQRVELAASAQYEYKRGDSKVTGPSIRLVEVLARNWGNIDFGVREIENDGGATVVKAYAWDLETNVSDEKTFTVPHVRSTKSGTYRLTDDRDIYEMVANKGARRKRACMLAVLPGWYVEAAVAACNETLRKSLTAGKNMDEVRASVVAAFAEFGITPEQISEKIGRDVAALTENDVVRLRRLYSTIKDGFIKASEAFGAEPQTDVALPSAQEQEELAALNGLLAGGNSYESDPG